MYAFHLGHAGEAVGEGEFFCVASVYAEYHCGDEVVCGFGADAACGEVPNAFRGVVGFLRDEGFAHEAESTGYGESGAEEEGGGRFHFDEAIFEEEEPSGGGFVCADEFVGDAELIDPIEGRGFLIEEAVWTYVADVAVDVFGLDVSARTRSGFQA